MFLTINDIDFHVATAGAGRPLVLLHGFTGAGASWAAHVPALAGRRRVIAPDLLGHGASAAPEDPARYRMERCVADLLTLLDALDAPQIDLLGYSMGGRVALSLACAAPERIGRLVLESASPGLADAGERAARTASDNALADSIEREGLAAFVDHWEALPLFASQQRLPEEVRAALRAQRLRSDPRGLANSLRGMGTGQMPPLWGALPALRLPVLLLAGGQDTRYCDLARLMAEHLPNARLEIVPEAGHTIHLERPQAFQVALLSFLDESRL
ncbi:MAG TPA: 2-succinyl-6-hydroxy-2,4-cyclohexadiene-1-carboxylate synthase [Roseiflexaceae bacterium]|nr:2-succinyl-6-hydroxy-2,4-cyclohexadiene-1-carboxylate synthase [Roseiflexaceae bacterium]